MSADSGRELRAAGELVCADRCSGEAGHLCDHGAGATFVAIESVRAALRGEGKP